MILQNNNYDATNLNFGHKKIVFSHLVMGSIGPLLVKLLLGWRAALTHQLINFFLLKFSKYFKSFIQIFLNY